jgi:RNA polymerase sigma factor (sigma-70 family)
MKKEFIHESNSIGSNLCFDTITPQSLYSCASSIVDNQFLYHNIIGDPVVYAQWYKVYFKKCYNYGRKFTADIGLIEDSIQEVFLDIWKKKEKLPKIESINGYLFASFRYILLKKIKQASHTTATGSFLEEPDFHIEQKIMAEEENKELQQKLQAAINNLTPRQKEAIFLRFYEGLSYEEVAVILNITVKATYKIMARSLLNLKEQYSNSTYILLIGLANILDALPPAYN